MTRCVWLALVTIWSTTWFGPTSVSAGDDDAHLDLLAVASAYRRAGIGRGLVRWLEECAITAGTFKIELEVRAGNEAAQLFYRSLGYAAIAQLPGYYQGVEAALRMGRDLAHRAGPQGR